MKRGFKKSRFVRKQEAKALLSNLGIKKLLRKILLLNVLLLLRHIKIINKFLLVGDKFMPELHLKQPEFTGACGPFT